MSAYLAGLCDDQESLICRIRGFCLEVLFHLIRCSCLPVPGCGSYWNIWKTIILVLFWIHPLGVLAEGFTLSKLADACVYVVRANVLRKESLRLLSEAGKRWCLPDLGCSQRGKG